MQRDLELLESLGDKVILRCYQWTAGWISYGYFQNQPEAEKEFPAEGLRFVRRPTGGGVVDHRNDFTYSLLAPKKHPLSLLPRVECYQRVHEIIQEALTLEKLSSTMAAKEEGGGSSCFVHPVPGDIIDPHTSRKIAGAAQRRTRLGLLHQGSILIPEMKVSSLVSAFSSSRLIS